MLYDPFSSKSRCNIVLARKAGCNIRLSLEPADIHCHDFRNGPRGTYPLKPIGTFSFPSSHKSRITKLICGLLVIGLGNPWTGHWCPYSFRPLDPLCLPRMTEAATIRPLPEYCPFDLLADHRITVSGIIPAVPTLGAIEPRPLPRVHIDGVHLPCTTSSGSPR